MITYISKGFGFIEGAEQNGYGLNTGLSEITDDILLLALDMFERAVDCLLLEVDALLRRPVNIKEPLLDFKRKPEIKHHKQK